MKKIWEWLSGNVIKDVGDAIDKLTTTKEEKLQGKMELFKMAVADRSSAREMYQNDSWLQKAFAIFFLIAWCALTFVMLNYFVFQTIDLQDWQIAFISSINGGISTKLSTIIDFLFGGSVSAVNNVKLKTKRKNENI